eukprot:13330505-Alexandrium_andersonii.AAC.1
MPTSRSEPRAPSPPATCIGRPVSARPRSCSPCPRRPPRCAARGRRAERRTTRAPCKSASRTPGPPAA